MWLGPDSWINWPSHRRVLAWMSVPHDAILERTGHCREWPRSYLNCTEMPMSVPDDRYRGLQRILMLLPRQCYPSAGHLLSTVAVKTPRSPTSKTKITDISYVIGYSWSAVGTDLHNIGSMCAVMIRIQWLIMGFHDNEPAATGHFVNVQWWEHFKSTEKLHAQMQQRTMLTQLFKAEYVKVPFHSIS